MRGHVGLPKASAVADELQRMCPDLQTTGLFMTLQEACIRSAISASDYGIPVDATASPGMVDTLAYMTELPRVFSAFSVPGGDIAVATMEGSERNPRIDDLAAATYGLGSEVEAVRRWEEGPSAGSVVVGGCGDVAAVMADDIVSAYAARFSSLLRTEATIDHGAIWILGPGGFIEKRKVGETQIYESNGWVVRILAPVRDVMTSALREHHPEEVAGYLHGRRNQPRRELTVAHASVEPLVFQSRSGVEIDTSLYENPTAGALEYVGWWHTHPDGGTEPSPRDEATASLMTTEPDIPNPLVFVIADPAGLVAHVRG